MVSKTVEEITGELLTLPAQTRLQLAETLVQSVGDFASQDVASAWDAEIVKRLSEYESGALSGIPSKAVFAEAREQLREASHLSSPGQP